MISVCVVVMMVVWRKREMKGRERSGERERWERERDGVQGEKPDKLYEKTWTSAFKFVFQERFYTPQREVIERRKREREREW